MADHVAGLAEAIATCGRPIERCIEYRVRQETLDYWQTVVRGRAGEVILVLRRDGGRYVVHTKDFYPKGTYRLLTGGIKPGEDLLDAVRREAYEETGLQVRVGRFLSIIHHRFRRGECTVPFTSYMFLVEDASGGESALAPRDTAERITRYREMGVEGLREVAEQLGALPPDWADWGRFRASAHRLAWELLRDEGTGEN